MEAARKTLLSLLKYASTSTIFTHETTGLKSGSREGVQMGQLSPSATS